MSKFSITMTPIASKFENVWITELLCKYLTKTEFRLLVVFNSLPEYSFWLFNFLISVSLPLHYHLDCWTVSNQDLLLILFTQGIIILYCLALLILLFYKLWYFSSYFLKDTEEFLSHFCIVELLKSSNNVVV